MVMNTFYIKAINIYQSFGHFDYVVKILYCWPESFLHITQEKYSLAEFYVAEVLGVCHLDDC